MYKRIAVFILAIMIFSSTSLSYGQTKDNYDEISKFLQSFVDGRLKLFIDKDKEITTFKTLYNNDEVNINSEYSDNFAEKRSKSQKIQLDFGKRIRNAKEVTGRDYHNSSTKIDITNVTTASDNTFVVSAIETTNLYYKAYGIPNACESFSDEHIFNIMKTKNKFVVLNEELPNSIINIDTSKVSEVATPTDTKQISSTTSLMSVAKASTAYNSSATATTYNGSAAVSYANTYWSNYNTSSYRTFDNDCTSYISQCIKAGYGIQDTTGSRQWFYIQPGYIAGIGYSSSWGAAQDSYEYWWNGQSSTTKYTQSFTTPPSRWTVLSSTNTIWNYAKNGNPIYYHTDPTASVYYNHAGIITGKIGTYDAGSIVTWRPVVNSHTNNRYQVDYTLYPYLDYQGMINSGYAPAVTMINLTTWTPYD